MNFFDGKFTKMKVLQNLLENKLMSWNFLAPTVKIKSSENLPLDKSDVTMSNRGQELHYSRQLTYNGLVIEMI